MRPDNFLLRRAVETNPTDMMTLAEVTAAPAKRAAALAWLGDQWILHDHHFLNREALVKHASTLEMLRPLWQRARGVEPSLGSLDGLRQQARIHAHYHRQNMADLSPPWVKDWSQVLGTGRV